VIEKELKAFVPENWSQVETWLKANFPNIPVYRVKNIIQATNGRQAWGMFKDGAIYIYENAEVGTVYHEVFHAVWRMFSDPVEQKAVLDEMRSRGGKFYDRASMNDVSYSEATEDQLEEKLAEEFRDYIQFKKIPAKPTKGRPYILKLFADMVTAIKEFFIGPNADSKVAKMFGKIGQGYYKSHVPFQNSLAFAKEGVIDIEDAFADSDAALSLKDINDKERSDIIQHMTYLTLADLIKTDESLFNIEKRNKKQVYAKLKDQVLETISQKIRMAQSLVSEGAFTQEEVNPLISNTLQLMQNVEDQWGTITERHEEYLKSYAIEFDENDNINLRDENNSGRETYQDATKIDNFKKSNSAVKILLATIPEVDDAGKLVPSSIGGAKLLPVSKTYISMMNNLHTSASVEEMLGRLRQMAVSDPNYRTLYKRITKRDWKDGGVDLSKVDTQHGLQLISSIWNTFKKQNPDVRNVFVLENGEVVVGEANLASAAQQLRSEYINSIVFKAKEGKGFFTYDDKEKVFKGDPAKLKGVNLNSVTAMVDFLNKMGIPFTVSDVNKMTPEQYKVFKGAVAGIKESISKTEKVATFSGKALGMSGRLLELGLVKSAVSNPEFSSTYFNVSGERTQSFIGTNAASDLYEFLSKLERFNKESVGGTRYGYLLTDSFAKGSNLLSRMFTDAGTRKENTEDLFKIGYVSGLVNEEKGKRKESSKLTYKDRLVQELNLNLSGYYLNLVPGDASIEWMIKMGNAISTASVSRGMGDINAIFKEYFKAELELVRENRPVAKGRKSNEMRFFKGILGDTLHSDVLAAKGTPEEVYKAFENKINGKLADFIQKDMIKLKQSLTQFGILKEGMLGFDFENINLPKNIGEKEVDRQLMALTANYMIANIEMHKLLYSDPYQYEDELKRIKSFNSPRQAIINSSPKMNAALSNVWNRGFSAGDIGFTKFTQDYFRSATHADVIGIIDLPNYTSFKETDGSGIISMKANRQFRIRAGNWNSEEERQYRYDVAWEKNDKNLPLSNEEVAILGAGNPGIQSAYTPLKPIVSGSKLAKNGTASSYNNVVLDKFALYPLSYRIMKEIDKDANAIKLYDKMQREDIDYVVFTSGRKVGAESPHETYKDGAFNNDPYKGVINVPFSIMSIQAEVPSKEDNLVTRGSQITKLITLDFMEAGVPVDFFPGQPFANRYKAWYKLSDAEKVAKSELYKEIKNNQDILEALIEEGYKNTLDRLGIKETVGKDGKKKFEITDFSKAAQTLRDEILKREVNDNISDALAGFLQGKVVLEATPAYQQVRNIIYSIADKQFISPKISGGMKVQIPSTMLESGVRNVKDGLYESDVLKFYEKDGKRVAEVMLGRWFDSPLSDEELLNYLNNTEEGQKILAGVGYRIPTQKQNSVDVIVIKKFLPKEFGDSVVIPAALVQKVGSDFDIDKLSVYLKNVYVKDGKPRLIPYFGIGEQAINKFKELFDKGEFLTEEEMKELDRYINEEMLLLQDIAEESKGGKLMSAIFGKLFSEEELTQEFTRGIPSKDQIISRLYKKSLENEYIQSMENLITHPKNYDNLIKPNSAESLKKLSEEIAEKTVGQSFDYKNVDNMLDRTFMSRLRHAFVTGKYAIGIAAVNQTNHSLNQRQPIYIDKRRLNRVSDEDRFWLDNADIKFDKYNAIEIDGMMMPTLSMITNKAGENISDIIGMFIDGYVDISKGPWIMELGATPNVASTWLFLIKAGVPVKTVAYFMNQPIIRDYLRSIESAGYSWLFMDTFVNLTAEAYGQDVKEADLLMPTFRIPGETALKNNVGKSISEMSPKEKTDQYLMLREFLKYAKMGEQMFHVTQGSNYDTSTFNDPYLVFKKQMQQIKAQNTIISSVDTLLANSFIGKLADTVNSVRDAFAQIIKSDSPKVRNVIQKVLLPYVETSDRDFVKLAQKAVADLFDWAVQTDQQLNEMIKDILVNDGGVGREVAMFVNEVKSKGREHALYGNHIIDIIEGIPSIRAAAGGPNNAKLNMGENKVYDQNNVIYAFRELRDYLKGENNPLYERIKLLAVLQSGLSTSPISFTNLLPYEDFESIYNKTLSKLEGMPNLEDFYKLGVFQRNNWNNDDVVPYLKAALIKTAAGRMHYNPSMKFLPDAVKQAMASNDIPPVLTRSKRNREANSDYIVYTWEKQEELLTKEELDKAIADRNVYKAIAAKKAEMRRAADYSYINKALFKKVYDNYGTALEHTAYDGQKYFVYKAINAWGDSFRANEFWATDHKSVIENGFMKVEDVDNNVIISKFLDGSKSKTTEKSTPKEKKDPFTC
jgi:spore coat protein CotF